jgi:hypothetical protein
MRNTPLCNAIAAAEQRLQLRTWLALAEQETHLEVFQRLIERIRGYLDGLDDEGLISFRDCAVASDELRTWVLERLEQELQA